MATEIITSFGQICDSNGVPVSGATVQVYDALTTTPRALFTDPGLTISTANPIVCDSSGRHQVGMVYTATGTYKIVVKTSAGATIFTRDSIDGRVPVGSGALAIVNGGTGATTPNGALAALGGATAAEVADVSAEVAALSGAQASTEKTHIATGTTAQRTATPVEGDIRRNTTTTKFEGFTTVWENFKTSADATSIAAVKAETVEDTYLRPDTLKQSDRVAKAWARIVVTAGTPTLGDQLNFSGIVDNGVGDFSLTFSVSMPNAFYCVVATAHSSSDLFAFIPLANATTIRVKITNNSGALTDPDAVSVLVFGDFV